MRHALIVLIEMMVTGHFHRDDAQFGELRAGRFVLIGTVDTQALKRGQLFQLRAHRLITGRGIIADPVVDMELESGVIGKTQQRKQINPLLQIRRQAVQDCGQHIRAE